MTTKGRKMTDTRCGGCSPLCPTCNRPNGGGKRH